MPLVNGRDTTSYSRDDKERVPNCWTATSGMVAIDVLNGHIYYKGQWVMHCNKIGIDTFHLKNCGSLEEAKKRAVNIVKQQIFQMLVDIKDIGAD